MLLLVGLMTNRAYALVEAVGCVPLRPFESIFDPLVIDFRYFFFFLSMVCSSASSFPVGACLLLLWLAVAGRPLPPVD